MHKIYFEIEDFKIGIHSNSDCVLSLPSYHGLSPETAREIAQNILEIVK